MVMSGRKKPATSAGTGIPPGITVLASLTWLILLPSPDVCLAAELVSSDALCRSVIFGEEIHSDVKTTRASSATMASDARFEFLVQRVLPEYDEATIRIDMDFAPACPSPVTAGLLSLSNSAASSSADPKTSRVSIGADLISPAIDLVDVAQETGRLGKLRSHVSTRKPDNPDTRQAQLAMLALIEMADGDFEAAHEVINRLHVSAAASPVTTAERGQLATVIWMGLRYPPMVEATRDLTFLAYEQARNQIGPRSECWHRQLYSMKHALQRLAESRKADTDQTSATQPLRNWIPVSRMTAETCGKGYPLAGWDTQQGQASHVTSHDHDYLIYAVPLTGDFEIEADLTTFGYRDIQLATGSFWAGPGYDCVGCLNGNFRQEFPTLSLKPKLTRMLDWMRVRVVVRNGIRTTFINGRDVFNRPHNESSDPWAAIHSPWYTSGEVRDLRVTSNSDVPRQIDMAASPDIPGWLPYFDESAGHDDSDWHLDMQRSPPVLIGRRKYGLDSSHLESLLRYHRPVAEDGVISYEFYYSPNRLIVHPALGRLAFLLDPSGVKVHWITDGRFDSTGLNPANTSIESANQRGAATLPLKVDDWNSLQLEVADDVARLLLNGELIYERPLEATNQRTFGLFHFADRSDAHVRNIRWAGDWLRTLPAASDQELADHDRDDFDASREKLSASYRHDFSTGLPSADFDILNSGGERLIDLNPDGIRVTRPGGKGWPNTSVVPKLLVHGDFDIIAEFVDFSSKLDDGAAANIQIYVALEDKNRTECRVFRTRSITSSKSDEQLAQAAVFSGPDDKRGYDFVASPAEEATAGRLRLARRGDQLQFLLAEDDSRFFRLLATHSVPVSSSRNFGIRLMLETPHGGTSSVTWKIIDVRADSLTGAAAHQTDASRKPVEADRPSTPRPVAD
mgnify:CR=1 FL=1